MAVKFKIATSCIQFYARLDRLIFYSILSRYKKISTFCFLFSSRRARKAKQAEGRINEIVSERIT